MVIKNKIVIIILVISFLISSLTIQGMKTNTKNQENDFEFKLLIIAPEKFAPFLIPLANHKIKHGIDALIVEVEDIIKSPIWSGKDDAEKVKYYIKYALDEWNTTYVLFVGGRKDQAKEESWWVPVRHSYLNRPYNKQDEFKFLSDLYFADIYDSEGNFSSWDTDNDGIFGEWPLDGVAEDIPNLFPDVYIGRLPCRNRFEVRTIVKKIINYETQSFSDSWFKKMLVVAGDTYPNKTPSYYDGEVYTQQAIELMSEFEPVKLWASEGALKNWFGIVRQINKGCGFIFFSGHGGPDVWVTHPVNDSKNWIGEFKLRHIPFLFNKNKLPVILSGSGCSSNMFNVSLGHAEHVDAYLNNLVIPYGIPRCWGWSLTRKPNGGGIAVISSTGYSYESSDIDRKGGGCEWLDIHFFEQYGKENVSILGECWGNTINRCLENFTINWNDTSKTGDALIVKNVEQWLLIGDPSLKIGGYN